MRRKARPAAGQLPAFTAPAETVTFDGGFVAPITNILDRDGYDLVGNTEDATFVVVKVPPEGLHVTIDLRDLRDEGVVTTAH